MTKIKCCYQMLAFSILKIPSKKCRYAFTILKNKNLVKLNKIKGFIYVFYLSH